MGQIRLSIDSLFFSFYCIDLVKNQKNIKISYKKVIIY